MPTTLLLNIGDLVSLLILDLFLFFETLFCQLPSRFSSEISTYFSGFSLLNFLPPLSILSTSHSVSILMSHTSNSADPKLRMLPYPPILLLL